MLARLGPVMFRSGAREWQAAQARKSCAPRLASPDGVSARAPATTTVTMSASKSEAHRAIMASCHADNAHHPAFLVVEDVAVEHPVAWVVGDERGLGALARWDPHC